MQQTHNSSTEALVIPEEPSQIFREIRKSRALEFDTGVLLISITCTTHIRTWTGIMILISVSHSFNILILKANNVSNMGAVIV